MCGDEITKLRPNPKWELKSNVSGCHKRPEYTPAEETPCFMDKSYRDGEGCAQSNIRTERKPCNLK